MTNCRDVTVTVQNTKTKCSLLHVDPTKTIQAPYSQADVVVFRQNARQQCVEMSVCLIYHNMKGNPSDLKQLIHIGNQLYGILSQLARQLYLQLTELPTMLTVSG